MLQKLGVESFLIRNLEDWDQAKDGLIIPGGESTAMMRIIKDENIFEPVKKAISEGLPVFGTCAGLIMLDKEHLGTMNITAKRNAYGRQLGSFVCIDEFKSLGKIPMVFIRAPYIAEVGPTVEVLSTVDGNIVAAKEGNQLVTAFHPELTDNTQVHQLFLEMCK